MNRRRIAVGVSSVCGVAVLGVSVVNMFSGSGASAVDLHTTPVAAVSAIGAATDRAGSAQIDTLITMTTAAVPAQGATPAKPAETLTMHGTGAYDFGQRSGSLDLTVGDRGAQAVLTPSALFMRAAATPPGAAPSPKAAPAPAGNWTRVGYAETPDGTLVTGGTTDPELTFALLAGVQPGVKVIGQDQVRGVPVVHYQGTLDLAQAAAAPAPAGVQPADAAAAKKALENAAGFFTSTKIPFDAYLDDQGRLRRFVALYTFTLKNAAKSPVQATTATELYGFGTPVAVQTPSVAPTPTPAPAAHPAASSAGAKHGGTTPTGHVSSPRGTHK